MTGEPSYLGPDDLVLSHFSLGRYLPFRERVEAAAGAGFAAIGLFVGDYERLRAEGSSDADLRAVLDDHGLWVVEIEALRGWAHPDDPAYREKERSVFAMADALGPAHHVQVLGPVPGSLDEAATAFAGLCDRAAEHGLTAAIEFLPEMTNLPDARTALAVVELAGRANGGLCVDVWHHYRGADDDDMLRAVPAERVLAVQVSDGPRARVDDDYYTDCTSFRQVPGEGELDLTRFLRLLDDIGVRLPLSVEVLSTQLLAEPPAAVARRLAEGTRTVLDAARSLVPNSSGSPT